MNWLSSVNQYKDQKYAGIIYDFTEIMYPTTVKANSNQGMMIFKRGSLISNRNIPWRKKCSFGTN